jgi:hypothetical protein
MGDYRLPNRPLEHKLKAFKELIKNLRVSGGKWAILAAALALAAPAWAQRDFTLLPTPITVDSVPPAITALPSIQSTASFSSLSTIRVPNNLPDKPTAPIGVERLPLRKSWIILSAVQHGAAAFDAYSTRQAIETGAVERDPLMRPFAGSPAIYFAIQAGPVLLDYASRKMQRNSHEWVRKSWWLPQTASTALFIASGVHNLGVANRP